MSLDLRIRELSQQLSGAQDDDAESLRLMRKTFQVLCVVAVLLFSGCDHGQRVAALEKENRELRETIKKSAAAADFDVASKCSDRAKVWVSESFPPEKGTIILNSTNHYNRSKNGCFVLVEWHYALDKNKNGSWTNHLSLWEVNENTSLADYTQTHLITYKNSEIEELPQPVRCETSPKPCSSLDDFKAFVSQYLND